MFLYLCVWIVVQYYTNGVHAKEIECHNKEYNCKNSKMPPFENLCPEKLIDDCHSQVGKHFGSYIVGDETVKMLLYQQFTRV